MNKSVKVVSAIWRAGLIVATGGTVLASSCSTSEVKAILAGVEVVTDQLDQAQNHDVSFGDWLDSVLN